ncbi:MAG TPA: DUF983 domain-containing protein [Acetobacteraceae bacterium]
MPPPEQQPPGLLRAALTCRCPRCGQGALFDGLLTVRERCPVCGLDLRGNDAGDGAVFAVIFVLGALVVLLAILVEIWFSPPLWVHAVIWPLFTVPAAILRMRPAKAALVAIQYRNRASEMGL